MILKRVDEGIDVDVFTLEECETIANIMAYIQTLAYGENGTSEYDASSKTIANIYTSDKIKVSISDIDGTRLYGVQLISYEGKPLVFQTVAEPVSPNSYNYKCWEFHDGSWVDELKQLALDGAELNEYLRAFLPFSEWYQG